MAKHKQVEVLGNIEISPEAIELIVGIAVSKVKEVHSILGYKKAKNSDVLKSLVSKGVILSTTQEGDLVVDVHVALYYGVEIPKVAKFIQSRVKEQVLFMCNIEIKEVNLHIDQLVSLAGE